jgi:hypothetical protein
LSVYTVSKTTYRSSVSLVIKRKLRKIMEITRVVKNQNGNVEATLDLKPEQAAYLINVGLLTLVQTGSLLFNDVDEEGNAVEAEPHNFNAGLASVAIQES